MHGETVKFDQKVTLLWSAKLEYMGERDNGVLVFIQATLLHGSSCLFVPKNILREKNDNDAQEWREVWVGARNTAILRKIKFISKENEWTKSSRKRERDV